MKVVDFLKLNLPHDELIRSYINICEHLLYEDASIIKEVTNKLVQSTRLFARRNSNFYRSLEKWPVIDKGMLMDKEKWYTGAFEALPMRTRGTTTGSRFSYLSWRDTFAIVEGVFHYGHVLKEFGLKDSPNIMHLLFQHPIGHKPMILRSPQSPLHSHGGNNSVVHVVHDEPPSDRQQDDYYMRLFDYLAANKIDVILTSGPVINSLAHFAKKFNVRHKLCKLLSNTCEPARMSDILLLQQIGCVDNWCDHMRCWDGGISFMTCKYGKRHLLDNLSYCVSVGGKLVSTDYFSLPAPFVNYWNGDYGDVGDEYHRCDCGRAYREFSFGRPREFTYMGLTSEQIKMRILSTGIGVKYVKCYSRHLEITLDQDLDAHQRLSIVESMPEIKNIRFTIEVTQ